MKINCCDLLIYFLIMILYNCIQAWCMLINEIVTSTIHILLKKHIFRPRAHLSIVNIHRKNVYNPLQWRNKRKVQLNVNDTCTLWYDYQTCSVGLWWDLTDKIVNLARNMESQHAHILDIVCMFVCMYACMYVNVCVCVRAHAHVLVRHN